MITAAQLRAARGLLDWSRSDLAKASNISPETIKNIEHGTFKPQEMTADAIVKAFAAHGVEFLENDGVRCAKDSVVRLDGNEGFKRFIDDVYMVAKQPHSTTDGNKPIYIGYVDDRLFTKHLGDYFDHHIKRMNELQNVKMKIIIQDKPYTLTSDEKQEGSYREYRQSTDHVTGNVPFYVYGDKLAILIFEESKPVQIVVITSSLVAKAYRDQFDMMWKSSKPLK